MNKQEYICIKYYHINDSKFFLPNLCYLFKYDGYNFINYFFICSIHKNVFKQHFMSKNNWEREQKINYILSK